MEEIVKFVLVDNKDALKNLILLGGVIYLVGMYIHWGFNRTGD